MDIKKVGDIMIPLDAYPHIPYWFSLRQAMIVMLNARLEIHEVKSLPRAILIFDKEYNFLGMLRRRDIIRGIFQDDSPDIEEGVDSKDYLEKLAKDIKDKAEQQVLNIMVPVKETVDQNDPVTNALHKMMKNELSLLPVLHDDRVVGVIRSVELFVELSEIMLEEDVRE